MSEIFSSNVGLFEQSQESWDIISDDFYAFSDNNPVLFADIVGTNPVTDQELRDAGYLLAIDYGVTGDGVTDNGTALQNWVEAIKSVNKVGYLHYSDDPYMTSKAISCLHDERNDRDQTIPFVTVSMIGGRDPSAPSDNDRRPVIKLVSGSLPLFDNPNDPCPMIAWQALQANSYPAPEVVPQDNPLDIQSGWQTQTGNLYSAYLQNINFDTNGHSGAIGIHMPGAQRCMMANVKVTATGSAIGISCWPATNAPSMNVEIIGGDVGAQFVIRNQGSAAGELLIGLKIDGATTPIVFDDTSCPAVIVGLEILNCPGTVYTPDPTNFSWASNLAIIDARIEITGGGNPLAFNNPGGKDMYLRNVWIKGTDNLIKSGSASTITGTGTWKKIEEYTCNNSGATSVPYQHTSRSLINGTVSSAIEPSTSIQSNATDPGPTRRTRHNILIPNIDDGIDYVDAVLDHGVAQGVDTRAALQAAIDAAETAGHNRVFLRKGNYDIGEASEGGYGIKLRANTQLFGVWPGGVSFNATGGKGTFIRVHDSWAPTSGQPVLIDTTDTTTGKPSITNIATVGRSDGGTATRNPPVAPTYERFGSIKWRSAGGFLCSIFHHDPYYYWGDIKAPPTNIRHAIHIIDHGAVRTYNACGLNNYRRGNRLARGVLIEGPDTGACIFYGHNFEVSKAASGIYEIEMEVSCEVINADNIVVYGQKKEGRSGNIQVTDGNNIAFFAGGVLDQDYPDYYSFYGNSNNLLVAIGNKRNEGDDPGTQQMVLEDLDATPEYTIPKNQQVSIYKRGNFDLDAIYALEK